VSWDIWDAERYLPSAAYISQHRGKRLGKITWAWKPGDTLTNASCPILSSPPAVFTSGREAQSGRPQRTCGNAERSIRREYRGRLRPFEPRVAAFRTFRDSESPFSAGRRYSRRRQSTDCPSRGYKLRGRSLAAGTLRGRVSYSYKRLDTALPDSQTGRPRRLTRRGGSQDEVLYCRKISGNQRVPARRASAA
jgi:hypothetical protein